ncbi:MAG: hypothetical protein M1385_01735 [Candidatus Marsarchaeota archaeon]|nr:hypothetical protein [Candidatus Marsarchaeota archaeon]
MAIDINMKALWKNPTEHEWELFSKKLKISNIKYYRVVYKEKLLKNNKGLKNAYIELYSNKKKLIGNVPLFMIKNSEICGATIYLKGIKNANMIE